MKQEELKSLIRELAEGLLDNEEYFVVGVVFGSAPGSVSVRILLDGDNGISIDECGKLSRALGDVIEERELFAGKYVLEVSTPGIDYPLEGLRRYRKNIGRVLKVTFLDKEEKPAKGELLAVDEDSITINEEIKEKGKGKKVTFAEKTIPFAAIEQAKVVISF
ncbi:ribosome maturation factor RimP [Fulvitalea axinellae]|uniref:Ribosome maturation factor RimP n=1 Tax=Fulvitalea axinellae TaxID=1182444 RepID=A0AAU9D310_9BACT|nr:ribosome maturation factor RimP [Fulvitalea axinellae]